MTRPKAEKTQGGVLGGKQRCCVRANARDKARTKGSAGDCRVG